MSIYILRGVVHPERAQFSLISPINLEITHPSTTATIKIKLNIQFNQITLWVDSDYEWEIHDLRNAVKDIIVLTVLSIFSFRLGHTFDAEIIHVMNDEKQIDYVYSIVIGRIYERKKDVVFTHEELMSLFRKTLGVNGIYVNRCFGDLAMATRNPIDTGFYCYRAIESLKQYCKNKFSIDKEADQWKKLSEITGYDQEYIEVVKEFARPVRHGDVLDVTDSNRVEIFMKTWDVVEAFLEKFQEFN
jgi:hypothetical protein